MQGIIFNALGEFVEEAAGLEAWNDVIEASKVESGGAYTSGATYADEEIIALATATCNALSIELNDGLKAFGKYLFSYLVNRGPVQIKEYPDMQTMLKELDSVIHKEVKRVHPDAYTPFFEYFESDATSGELMYKSDRQLCVVAEGLLEGGAEFYNQTIALEHSQCTHRGGDECRWKVQFS